MKKYLAISALAFLAIACTKESQSVVPEAAEEDAITFSSDFTRVVTDCGVNTWEAGDSISVFSLANGAPAGEAIDTNVIYKTDRSGASVTFSPVAESVGAADRYVAYYPGMLRYSAKLNADETIGFAGAAAASDVTDCRFMPVIVNSGYTAYVNSVTRTAGINTKSFFYAVADAPAAPGATVGLSFTPVLPILEFGFFGKGTIKKFTAAYADASVDVIGEDKSNWLTAKGVFNPADAVLATTNYNTNAYYKIDVTLSKATELSATEATRFPMTVGRFKVTKGLVLTFTDARGNSFSKTIWTGSTMSGVNAEGKCVHLYQKVNVPYLVADTDAIPSYAAAGGSADIALETTAGDWTVGSKPEWISLSVNSGASCTVAVSAAANPGSARSGEIVLVSEGGPKCYVAVSQAEAAASDWYKVSAASIDWSSSRIQYVLSPSEDTLAIVAKEMKAQLDTELVVNLYKGKDFTAVQTASQVWYVSADGTSVTASEPSGTVGDASYGPMYLTSPSGENNPLVKINNRLFTVNGYKTTRMGDGTAIPVVSPAAQTTPAVVKGDDCYIYNAYAVGCSSDGSKASFKEGFAPEGWSMIDGTVWGNMGSYIGKDAATSYQNFKACGLFTRDTYKLNGKAIASLGYVNTWSTAVSANNLKMLYVKAGKTPSSSAQALTAMFECIVYKEVQLK